MKAILFSIGSRGDIEPFLAIAQILQEKDLTVICVFPEQFRETVEKMGLKFRGFSSEFLELLNSKDAKMLMGGQGSLFKRFKTIIQIGRVNMKLIKERNTLQHNILKEEKPNRVLYHPKCGYNVIWGMANPGKSIMVSPIPFFLHPINHINMIGGSFGILINKVSWSLVNNIKAIANFRSSKRFLKDYKGVKFTISSVKKAMFKKEKSIYTISPSLFPKPNYWPTQVDVVGYYERDKTLNWQPDKNLIQFLEENKKIIFISFGSMSNSNPKEKTRIIIEVLKRNNISAIISTSWGGLEKITEPLKSIHFLNDIPYDWIFPKIYAVVHHGGSGTTHTGLKYACPTLIIPHIFDQFYWNKIISKLQIGPKGMSIKKLNKINFEKVLLDLLENNIYKKNAEIISEKMKKENDTEKLVKLILE